MKSHGHPNAGLSFQLLHFFAFAAEPRSDELPHPFDTTGARMMSKNRLGVLAPSIVTIAASALLGGCHCTVALSVNDPGRNWAFRVAFLPTFAFSGGSAGHPFWIAPGDGFRIA